jgi:hypothetical protein
MQGSNSVHRGHLLVLTTLTYIWLRTVVVATARNQIQVKVGEYHIRCAGAVGPCRRHAPHDAQPSLQCSPLSTGHGVFSNLDIPGFVSIRPATLAKIRCDYYAQHSPSHCTGTTPCTSNAIYFKYDVATN